MQGQLLLLQEILGEEIYIYDYINGLNLPRSSVVLGGGVE